MLRSPLTHFLFAGIALFAARAFWNPQPELSVLEIPRSEINLSIKDFEDGVGRPASTAERQAIENQVVENALWLEQAWALGLHEVDPVVRQRLLQNMRFLDSETKLPEAELLEQAISLGMAKSDPVIKRRLIERVQALLQAGVRAKQPGDEALRSHYQENFDRWRTPSRLDFSHVYFSRDRRRSGTQEDAAALLDVLIKERTPPEAGIERGDPFLSGHRLRGATPTRIVARFGPQFEASVADARTRQWFGPIASAFGSHLVWIHERAESRVPDYQEVQTLVLEDWVRLESRRSIRAEINRHRERIELRIVEDAAPNLP